VQPPSILASFNSLFYYDIRVYLSEVCEPIVSLVIEFAP